MFPAHKWAFFYFSNHFLLFFEEFRRAITNVLNRGEKYNQLYQAIALLNGGTLKGSNEVEMEIWNQCTRLIASIIHYYNAYTLNQLYVRATTKEERGFILQFLPTAWGHINLLGRYEFCTEVKSDWLHDWIKSFDWKRFQKR